MPQTRKPPRNRVQPEMNGQASSAEILTLAEAAEYLRVGKAGVLRLIGEQALPARQVDGEWRFLKSAIQRWLARESPTDTSRAAQLAVVGSWRNDPFVEAELRETYERRRASASGEAT
jgi:excisionase family DNA binding protein